MPEMSQIHQLVAIADTGTISKAAEQLHISQPALTRSIQRLESEWNVTLFDRKKNKVTLNPTGELAVQYARQVLHDVESMTAAVKAYERSLRTIFIGFCAPGPLPGLYAQLSSLFSGMTILSEEHPQNDLLHALQKGTYQLVLTNEPLNAPDILCRHFCDEQLYLVVPPTHPLASRTDGVWFQDLAGETMLLYHSIGAWKTVLDKNMQQTTFILQDQVDAFDALLSASSLPAFATNLTLGYRNHGPKKRVALPFLDPDSRMPFYCSVLRKNAKYLPPDP